MFFKLPQPLHPFLTNEKWPLRNKISRMFASTSSCFTILGMTQSKASWHKMARIASSFFRRNWSYGLLRLYALQLKVGAKHPYWRRKYDTEYGTCCSSQPLSPGKQETTEWNSLEWLRHDSIRCDLFAWLFSVSIHKVLGSIVWLQLLRKLHMYPEVLLQPAAPEVERPLGLH